jgi:UDP-N-acetylglucosamine--N-acetylmuramyl-(pentapeptide) pyrophosphoryl-undecaprenol N-acetylglucosamine transferase
MYAGVEAPVHVMNPPRIDKGMKLLLPFTAIRALINAAALLKKNRIDVVLGTGGYSSFFAIVAAWITGRPAALFESNAVSGRSNRTASRFCREAYTGFTGGARGLRCRTVNTGTPVPENLLPGSREEARISLGIPVDKPVVLFLGGSQGARAVNDLALEVTSDITVLLQCGDGDYQRVINLAAKKTNLVIEPFVNNLSKWYSAAELAVARAGGQTIAELSAFRLPAVLIPFPYAAEDHQTANAEVVEKAGACVLKQQAELHAGELSLLVSRLIKSPGKLAEMKNAMATIYPADPACIIAGRLKEMAE